MYHVETPCKIINPLMHRINVWEIVTLPSSTLAPLQIAYQSFRFLLINILLLLFVFIEGMVSVVFAVSLPQN